MELYDVETRFKRHNSTFSVKLRKDESSLLRIKKLSCASFQITKCLCDADVLFMFVESLFHPFRSKYLRRKLWQTGLDFKEG